MRNESENQFIGYVDFHTAKAIKFQDHFWSDADWMPKSQITIIEQEGTTEVIILASDWICKQKDLNEFDSYTPVPYEG